MRYLGVDPGTKRIGLAVGDELGLASPLPALTQPEPVQRWQALLALVRQQRIGAIVLGYPLNMDDSVGPKAREAEAWAERLRKELNLPVHLVDERLTSHEAEASVPKHKRRALRASGVVDSRAATLILQDFLNQHHPAPSPYPEEDDV